MKSLSFQHYILLGFLGVALVPLLIGNMLIVNIFNASLQTQMTASAQSQVESMARSLEDIFSSCVDISHDITRNPMIANALLDRSDTTQTEVNLALFKAGNVLRRGAVLSLYDAGGSIRFTSDSASADAILPIWWGGLRKASDRDGMIFYNIRNYPSLTAPYAMYTAEKMYTSGGGMVGYALISLSDAVFESALFGLYSERNAVFLLDASGDLAYSAPLSATEVELKLLQRRILQGFDEFEDEQNQFYIREIPASGFYVVLRQPKLLTVGAVETMRMVVLFTSAFGMLLSILFSGFISGNLSRPISRLSRSMERLKRGELDVRVETNRNDQLGRLLQDFNIMAEELGLHIDKNMRQQQEMVESRIRLLQAQLNPHFLYNTLDTVKWLAKINHIPEIADISGNLALILRACASGDNFVPLSRELEIVKSYIDIQRIRFSGKFRYHVSVPAELADCLVPKLILQPVVENAILHGLADSQSGYVYLYTLPETDGTLSISITDDGRGMSPELVERLNQTNSRIVDGHLGLYNVNQIIKLNYGESYGLRATSEAGVGTTVTISLPVQRSELQM